jgi:hypothetical protein
MKDFMRVHSYWIQLFLAILSIFSLLFYLLTISSEIDPSRYIDTTTSIFQRLNLNDAYAIEELSEVLPWLSTLTSDIGGRTHENIKSLCSYDNPNQQTISYQSYNLTIVDPRIPSSPCPYDVNLFNKERMVSLNGNNQLLTFALYFSRSNYQSTGKEDGITDSKTSKYKSYLPNPRHDPYYIEILIVPWGLCILTDGKFHSLGSTFNWNSRYVESELAFQFNSSAYINGTLYYPCYGYITNNETGDDELISGDPFHTNLDDIHDAEKDYSNKQIIWIVKALDYYIRCLDVMSSAQPIMAYLTSYNNKTSYYELDYLSTCTQILATSPSNLTNHYIYDNEFHDNKITPKKFGTFFECSSELDWLISAHTQLTREYLMDSLNDFTRSLDVYALSRNLGHQNLFYSLTTITFTFNDNGEIRVTSNINYSPIIQFTYGTTSLTSNDAGTESSGYVPKRLFLTTYVLEVVYLILFAIYTLFTINKFIQKFYTVYMTLRSITPLSSGRATPLDGNHLSALEMVQEYGGSGTDTTQRGQQQQQQLPWERQGNGNGDSKKNEEVKVVHFVVDSPDLENQQLSLTHQPNTVLGQHDPEDDPTAASASAAATQEYQKNSKELAKTIEKHTIAHHVQHDHLHLTRRHSQQSSSPPPLSSSSSSSPYLTYLRIILFPFTLNDLLDTVTLTAVVLCIIYRVLYLQKSLEIHDILVNLDIELGAYDSELENILHSLLRLGVLEIIYVNVIAVTVGVLLLQFFRYISFDERLAMISLTIYESLSLLFPVLLVFIVVLGSYAVIGQAIYGKLLVEFSTTYHALNTLFFFVLGDTGAYYLSTPPLPLRSS